MDIRNGKVLIQRSSFIEMSNCFLMLSQCGIDETHVRQDFRGISYPLCNRGHEVSCV